MPELIWTQADQLRAEREGWNPYQGTIQALGDAFSTNEDALDFVRVKAEAGSKLHRKALACEGLEVPPAPAKRRASKLTKPVSRLVVDAHGKPLVVTLTTHGVTFRRPRHTAEYLLPYTAGETRAQVIANDGVGLPVKKRRRR